MAYTKTDWVNGGQPAISATNLNKIENGIASCDSRATTLENALGALNSYSTTETAIGTWIDGRVIYRKVIPWTPSNTIGASSASNNYTINHGITNFNMQIGTPRIAVTKGTGTSYIIPYMNGSSTPTTFTGVVMVSTSSITLRIINDTWSGFTFYFILEYVKTS